MILEIRFETVLFVIYGRRLFSGALTITWIIEMSLYELSMCLLVFDMGIISTNLNVCGMMLLFSALLYILVWYVNPRGPKCFLCVMVNLSEPVELFLPCFISP